MEKNGTGILEQYTGSLSHRIEQEYHIGEELYRGDIKRGLRNSDGTGVPIGVTRVSAGVSTAVGGRVVEAENSGQFDISDHRSVQEMTHDLAALGYQAVAKDWEACDF